MSTFYILIVSILFIVWQLSFLYRAKFNSLESLAKTNDINRYKTEMVSSMGIFIVLAIINHYYSNFVVISTVWAALSLLLQLLINGFMLQYKYLMKDLDYINHLRINNQEKLSKEILLRIYNRAYKYILYLYESHVYSKGYITVVDEEKSINVPEGLLVFVFNKFENLVIEAGLENELGVQKDRKRIEDEFLNTEVEEG